MSSGSKDCSASYSPKFNQKNAESENTEITSGLFHTVIV